MFEQTNLGSPPPRAAILLGYFLEVLFVGGLALAPMIHTDALDLSKVWQKTLTIPTAPPPPAPAMRTGGARKASRPARQDRLYLPPIVPPTIEALTELGTRIDAGDPTVGVVTGVPPGGPVGVPGGMDFGKAAPPPLLPARQKKTDRIRVGGIVEAAKIIYQPKPEYPPLAILTRCQGVVRLEAVISKDGTVEDLKVLQGPALLIGAAVEAVARWRYQPTLLNGEPVEVVTEIEVNFSLAD